jgi:glc operon protein GlcG
VKLASKKVLGLELAKRIAAASRSFAQRSGWSITVAIVDAGGHLVYLERADGIAAGTVQVAILKARSAAAFEVPSKNFEDAVAAGLVGLVGLPGMAPFEGAVPIRVEGQVIGAVAVSGVTKEADGAIAQAGADAVAGIVEE